MMSLVNDGVTYCMVLFISMSIAHMHPEETNVNLLVKRGVKVNC